jgi:hypothetical protein
MDIKRTWLITGIGLIALAAAFILVAVVSPDSGQINDNAAALAAIAAAAVGIERIIEGFWVVMGYLKGTWWPLNLIGSGVADLIASLDSSLAPVYAQAAGLAVSASSADQKASKQITDIQTWITNLRNDIAPAIVTDTGKAPLDKQKLQLVLTAASNSIDYLDQQSSRLQGDLEYAQGVIKIVSDAINTLNDNPGRRLISIFIGALLGLVVTGISGFNLFTLILGTDISFHLGTAVTGIVIGLGSGPTHEVVELLKEIKLNRRQHNEATA